MTIKQLRYIVSVTDNGFNISATAEKLFTSQPGISKQIRLLEEELGCDVFIRSGKALQGLSEKGEIIVKQARVVLAEYHNLLRLAEGDTDDEVFRVATTATQSNYVLPPVLQAFHQQYPNLKLDVQDGSFDQLVEIANSRTADCIILSGINDCLRREWFPELLLIPCYEWHQMLLCPSDHPLAKKAQRSAPLTAADLAAYPVVTYPASTRSVSALEARLAEDNCQANIVTTLNDPKTIKSYVIQGMGIGLLAPMAFNPLIDTELQAISLEGLLPKCTTIIAVERHNILKPHVYQFIKLFAPHLSNLEIEQAVNHQGDIQPESISLPDQIGTWVI